MDLQPISSWREFDEALAEANLEACRGGRPHASLVFRGLARATYSNLHSLARLGDDFDELERHLIRNFRKYAYRTQPGDTIWDWLSLAQHHGLPTRLLDWTFSPLVAAHFATATYGDEESAIWTVDCAGAHELLPDELRRSLEREGATVFTTDLLAEHAPRLEDLEEFGSDQPFALFFEPPSLDDRIVNQAAVLSTLSENRASMDEWIDAHDDICRGWRLSVEAKGEIRERLDQAGVTERVLMPGLDGLASWLRRYYAPGRAGADPGEGGSAMGAPQPA